MKKNAVIAEGVYLCSRQGYITKQVLVQYKNARAAEMYDWIIGILPSYKSYYQDYLDFVHYCEVLDIDLKNDDMTKYQADFINKLIVTTVTPNKQYDVQVYDAILNKQPNVAKEVVDNSIETTISTFMQVCDTDANILKYLETYDSVQSQRNLQLAISIYNTYCLLYRNTSTVEDKYYWENGFLFYDGEIVVLSAKMIGVDDFTDDRCLISELGYCVQVSSRMSLYVMTVDCAVENLKNKVSIKDPEYKYNNWLRFGV